MGFTSARRWMASLQRKKDRKQMTEGDLSPDEARTGLLAALALNGAVLQEVLSYDTRKDIFHVLIWLTRDKRLDDAEVDGETIVQFVYAARLLAGQPKGLLRPRDVYAALKGMAAEA